MPRSLLAPFAMAVLSAASALCAQVEQQQAPRDRNEWFETSVRPVLAQRCHSCHGPRKQKSELRLDHLQHALRGGERGPALTPGDPDRSRLVKAIGYADVDLQMPPKGQLPDDEIAILTEWIRAGAYWPDEPLPTEAAAAPAFDLDARRHAHWSWRAVRPAPSPPVRDTAWPRDAVDRFVLARLEETDLHPAPDADDATWLRRVHFTLVGLPPHPRQLAAFLADDAPNAREKAVDELLDSPYFGERWARHWLDLVRYAETMGHEYDFPVHHAWRYRDYVIRALNADVPYDVFAREHIAGDLLPEPRRNPADGSNESVIGTAFYWFGDQSHSPVDSRKALADRIDNQIDVLSKTFLGLTVACARCHDHKFDAISTKDYYALFGYLKSSRYGWAITDPPDRDRPTLEHLKTLQTRLQRAARQAWREEASTVAPYLLAATGAETERRAEAEERAPANSDEPPDRKLSKAERKKRDERRKAERRRRERAQKRRIQEYADRYGIDSKHLERWVGALRDRALDDRRHPLHAWRALTQPKRATEKDADGERRVIEPRVVTSVADRWIALLDRDRAARPAKDPNPVVFADFDAPDAHHFEIWHREGNAFGDGPVRHGDAVMPGPDGRLFGQVLSGGWAHSGKVSRRAQGSLHSPTFDIDKRYIHVLAAGREARINVVVDGFNLIRAPIYGSLKRVVQTNEPRWFRFDVGMWRAHRAYVQLHDLTTADPGNDGRYGGYAQDGFLAVQKVVFSNDDRPPQGAIPDPRDLLGARPIESLEELAHRYARATAAAIDEWSDHRSHPGTLDHSQQALLNWLLGRELLRPTAAVLDLAQVYRNIEATIPAPTLVPAMADGTGEDARVHVRGSHKTLGDVVRRRFLEGLGHGIAEAATREPSGSGRLELARQITDPDNPFVSRTIVNRVWHHVFGRGLVATVDNFGVLGAEPTHPQLLDRLAADFVADGWSLKRLIRRLVLSRTFAMSSQPDPDADDVDPRNLLLHRARIRRLEGEALRDAILAVSGRLDLRAFGPGVPVHLTRFMEGRGRPERSGPSDGAGRRSIYLEVRRNFLNPMFLAFDTPPPFATVGRRSVSNVPAQALALLNDPFVVGQARVWAERVLADGGATHRDRVRGMYRKAFARLPDRDEENAALAFVLEQSARHGCTPDDLRAWSDLAHVLLNTKEFCFVH